MQLWRQDLGLNFPSELRRTPTLLTWTPERQDAKYSYLASIGVTTHKSLQKKCSQAFVQSLDLMQRKVASLEAAGFTQVQVASLVEKHPDILRRSAEVTQELLLVIDKLFGCAMDRKAVTNVILSCNVRRLFAMAPSSLYRNFSYFCACVDVDEKQNKRAWKNGVFVLSPAQLDARLNLLGLQLSATQEEAKGVVRKMPQIIHLRQATIELHVKQFHGLGFSQTQVKDMCLMQPILVTFNCASKVQRDKWGCLTCVLQLSHATLAATPQLLMSSLPNRTGPRWEYLQHMKQLGVRTFTVAHQVIHHLVFDTNPVFSSNNVAPSSSILGPYDEVFQALWQQRWEFLVRDQQLTFQDIAAHPDVLQTSLKDTLGPRWSFLSLIASGTAS